MNVLLADGPITQSKSPTTKICLPETGFIRALKISLLPMGRFQCQKVPGGLASNQSDFRSQLN